LACSKRSCQPRWCSGSASYSVLVRAGLAQLPRACRADDWRFSFLAARQGASFSVAGASPRTALSSSLAYKAHASPTRARSTSAPGAGRSTLRRSVPAAAAVSGGLRPHRGSRPSTRPGRASSGPSARRPFYPRSPPTTTALASAFSALRLARLPAAGSALMPSSSRGRAGASCGSFPLSGTTRRTSGSSATGSPL
jgi:hypothetical protein